MLPKPPILKLSHVRWIFFDLGNTLISEEKAIKDRIQQMVRAFAERDIQVSAEAIEWAFEEASAEFAPRLIVRAIEKLASNPSDRAFVLQKVKYRKKLEEPYSEAFEVISRLAQRYRIGVIANQSAGAEARLKSYGLDYFISLCISSTEVGLKKPEPAIFQLALELAKCQPHQAVMIGDRIDNDIRPAKSLGWKTIRVLQGFAKMQTPRNPTEEPDFTVSNLKEIISFCSPLPKGAGGCFLFGNENKTKIGDSVICDARKYEY
ncbi:HAD family hydrolase [bacterium]|nr:HAD family hydrolase [bacterium]